jgi:hypothetical protein
MNSRTIFAAAFLAGAIAIGSTYAWQLMNEPKIQVGTSIEDDSVYKADTRLIISTAIENLRAENKLVVYTYEGSSHVQIIRDPLKRWPGELMDGVVEGKQELIVPAAVSYQMDMARFGPGSVEFDEVTKTVSIKLPPLQIGTVTFQSERARVLNSGILTVSDDVVQDLQRGNYRTARAAFTKQARQPAIVGLAEHNAKLVVARQFEALLAAAGRPDLKVEAHF